MCSAFLFVILENEAEISVGPCFADGPAVIGRGPPDAILFPALFVFI